MAEQKQLNTAWLAQLANAHHDGTTQQIDDFVQAFLTDNAVLTQKKATLHQARQTAILSSCLSAVSGATWRTGTSAWLRCSTAWRWCSTPVRRSPTP